MIPYIGNGPYCYANSTAMLLASIGENVPPSQIEVLTGAGLGAFWVPDAKLIYFSNTPPDVGVSIALETLGFECIEKALTEAEAAPFEALRASLIKSPAVLGPLDMAYLDYLPYHENCVGADHYVLAYAMDQDEVHLHDPDGFPHVSLSLGQLDLAWKAERIGYRRGAYRYWAEPRRARQPTEPEIYDCALKGFLARYQETGDLPGREGPIVGRDAILACADHVRAGAPPSTAGFMTGFAFRLGARRALDYAQFFEPHNGELAALKRDQAELFGQCHMCAIRAAWTALAERLKALADVETAFRAALERACVGDVPSPLVVEARDLAPVRVAYIEFTGDVAEGEHSHEIGACFQKVRHWVASLGHDLDTLLHIGIAKEEKGRPTGYACCVSIPESVESGSGEIRIRELVGGRYAVLTTDKDPSICGPIIGRFYQEYVPQKGIEIDDARPTYEIYYERTLEYCIPIC